MSLHKTNILYSVLGSFKRPSPKTARGAIIPDNRAPHSGVWCLHNDLNKDHTTQDIPSAKKNIYLPMNNTKHRASLVELLR